MTRAEYMKQEREEAAKKIIKQMEEKKRQEEEEKRKAAEEGKALTDFRRKEREFSEAQQRASEIQKAENTVTALTKTSPRLDDRGSEGITPADRTRMFADATGTQYIGYPLADMQERVQTAKKSVEGYKKWLSRPENGKNGKSSSGTQAQERIKVSDFDRALFALKNGRSDGDFVKSVTPVEIEVLKKYYDEKDPEQKKWVERLEKSSSARSTAAAANSRLDDIFSRWGEDRKANLKEVSADNYSEDAVFNMSAILALPQNTADEKAIKQMMISRYVDMESDALADRYSVDELRKIKESRRNPEDFKNEQKSMVENAAYRRAKGYVPGALPSDDEMKERQSNAAAKDRENAASLQGQYSVINRAIALGWNKEVEKMKNSSDWEEKSKLPKGQNIGEDFVSRSVGNRSDGQLAAILNGDNAAFLTQDEADAVKYFTDDEKRVFSYLYRMGDNKEIHSFIDAVKSGAYSRRAEDMEKKTAEFTREHPILSNIGSVAEAVPAGAKAVGNALERQIDLMITNVDEPLDVNAPSFDHSRKRDIVMDTTVDKYNMGPVTQFLYQTGMSIADNSLQIGTSLAIGGALTAAGMPGAGAAVVENLPLVLMSGNAYESAVKDATERGATASQAQAYGLASGAIEVITEKIPLDNLLGSAKEAAKTLDGKKAGQIITTVVKELGKQSAIEGLEEIEAQVMGYAADGLILGENSEYNKSVKAYMEDGNMSQKDAEKQVVLDMLAETFLAGLGGAISGGVMGGAGQLGGFTVGKVLRHTKSGKSGTVVGVNEENGTVEIKPEGSDATVNVSAENLQRDVENGTYEVAGDSGAENAQNSAQETHGTNETRETTTNIPQNENAAQTRESAENTPETARDEAADSQPSANQVTADSQPIVNSGTTTDIQQSENAQRNALTTREDHVNALREINPKMGDAETNALLDADNAMVDIIRRTAAKEQKPDVKKQLNKMADVVEHYRSTLEARENTTVAENTTVRESAGTDAHTPEMQKIIDEYNNSVDDGLLNFIEYSRNNKNDNKSVYTMSEVSDRAADDIEKLTGIDVKGYEHSIKANSIRHIDEGHGAEGTTDKSMSDSRDIARMQYVLDNYDSVELLPDRSKEYRDKNQVPAPMVRFVKRVDGTYYIAEAVPDTRRQQLAVVSAYKTKGSRAASTDNADGKTVPPVDVRNVVADASNDSIQQDGENVKGNVSEAQNRAAQTSEEKLKSVLPKAVALSDDEVKQRYERMASDSARSAEEARTSETDAESGMSAEETKAVVNRLTEKNINDLKLINELRKRGIKITLFEADADVEGFMKDDEIFININAEDPIRAVLGHELLHLLKTRNRAAFDALIKSVRDGIKDGTHSALYEKYEAEYGGVYENFSEEDFLEEFLADLAGDLSEDGAFGKSILKAAQKTGGRNVIRSVIEAIGELVRKLKSAIKSLAGNSETKKRAIDYIDNAGKLRRELIAAYRGMMNSESGTNAESGGEVIRFSLADENAETDDKLNTKTLLNVLRENAPVFQSESDIFNVKADDVPKGKNASDAIANYFESIGGTATNPTLGTIELTKRGAKSTVFHGIGPDKMTAVAAIKDVIEKGIIINSTENWKSREYNTYIIAGKGLQNGRPAIIGVVVKAYPHNAHLNNKFYLHEVIKIGTSADTVSNSAQSRVNASIPTNSISENGDNVNTESENSNVKFKKKSGDTKDDRGKFDALSLDDAKKYLLMGQESEAQDINELWESNKNLDSNAWWLVRLAFENRDYVDFDADSLTEKTFYRIGEPRVTNNLGYNQYARSYNFAEDRSEDGISVVTSKWLHSFKSVFFGTSDEKIADRGVYKIKGIELPAAGGDDETLIYPTDWAEKTGIRTRAGLERAVRTLEAEQNGEKFDAEQNLRKRLAKEFYRDYRTKSPFFISWFGDWRANDMSMVEAEQISDMIDFDALKNAVGYTFSNKDMYDAEIRIGKNGEVDRFSGKVLSRNTASEIKNVIRNAVLLDSEMPDSKKKKSFFRTLAMHKLYSPVIFDGKSYIVKISIEEYAGNNGAGQRFFNLQNIEMLPVGTHDVGKERTVSDIFNLAKTYDKEFKTPKPASKAVDGSTGRPKIFYYGGNKFNAAEKGLFGEGVYVSETEDSARERAAQNGVLDGKLQQVYLNIKNPFIAENRDNIVTLELKEQGYDGIYSPNEKMWVAFSPEQVSEGEDIGANSDTREPINLEGVKFKLSDNKKAPKISEREKALRDRVRELRDEAQNLRDEKEAALKENQKFREQTERDQRKADERHRLEILRERYGLNEGGAVTDQSAADRKEAIERVKETFGLRRLHAAAKTAIEGAVMAWNAGDNETYAK